ncbi:MAG: hypothetical protein KC445_15985, partial [Anaerolineales bacterium]|nr:hypothetical protein [Anaerolineales bacterium]
TEYGGVLSWFYPTIPIYTPNLNLSYYLSPYQDNLQDILLPDLNFNPQFISQELLSQKYHMLPDAKERKPLPNVDYESVYQFHHITELKTEQKAYLRQKMTDHLNYNDLRTLCFDYDFYDHDEITESRGKAAVNIAIIDACRRKGRIPELLSALYKGYPKIDWIQQ